MKKSAAIVLLAATLTLTACGQTNSAEIPQNSETVQSLNPWYEITEAEAKTLCPGSLAVPKGAENVQWSAMKSGEEPTLVQLSFDLDGNHYTAREQAVASDKIVDISGMYYNWTEQFAITLETWGKREMTVNCFRYTGEKEDADLCTWYDETAEISYSLGVTAKELDGLDLQAIVEALCAPEIPTAEPALSVEKQRRILEENRSLWMFDEGEYAPDWYYTFTDLDHNGLLEVLSASTQGSGIYTYAHYYEVLPDGSGIKNLYHAGMEIEGLDDWPEIIMDSLPCYYDRAADCYYYVCADSLRIGAAHSITWQAALSMKDGVAEWEYLASKEVQRTEEGETVSYMDGSGNPISEQDYSSAVERRFAGMERSELKLDWIAVTASESGETQ